ncbi:MAG TPA: DUF4112 domain-containing protein [Pararhizobium sp.]|uniref:DUF4112 domain-containing protein n=1 Tax=Pararhizobium sp. TaxID=1977563 RepID=UPI002C2B459E|nr:DUF4112 domain-containing protein [Pararhizobium sp.]HTO29728.1 DUF4112 domain-containing protein [Pararhizobium sp.]
MARHKLIRMVYNLGMDAVIGAIPVLGNVFDVYFKSHKRNIQLILEHLGMDRADLG